MRAVAYDLSRFSQETESQEKPKVRVVDNPRQKKGVRIYRLRVTFFCTFLLVLMALTVYNSMLLTETKANVNTGMDELTRLESEYTYLNWQLESRISLKNAEEYAETELGLVKMSAQQIEYINLSSDNQIVGGEADADGLFENIWKSIKGLFE